MGKTPFGIDPQSCLDIARSIDALREGGVEIGIVIGGGNIFRGISLKDLGMERSPADQIGMLSTMINGIALQQSLERIGCPARILSAIECPRVAESYTWRYAKKCLAAGEVLIFVGGTGNPYFTTDTAAALRASEIGADIFMKATKVDGIYDRDPLKHSEAVKYDSIDYSELLEKNLGVMDATSVALCRSNKIPILVFNMEQLKARNSVDALLKMRTGTIVGGQ